MFENKREGILKRGENEEEKTERRMSLLYDHPTSQKGSENPIKESKKENPGKKKKLLGDSLYDDDIDFTKTENSGEGFESFAPKNSKYAKHIEKENAEQKKFYERVNILYPTMRDKEGDKQESVSGKENVPKREGKASSEKESESESRNGKSVEAEQIGEEKNETSKIHANEEGETTEADVHEASEEGKAKEEEINYDSEKGLLKGYIDSKEVEEDDGNDWGRISRIKNPEELKNTEINISDAIKVKVSDLIPNFDSYIKDKENIKDSKFITDIKLLSKMFPYFIERLNQQAELSGKPKIENIEILNDFTWEKAGKNFSEAKQQWKKFIYNIGNYTESIKIDKFLNNMEKDKIHQEDLKEMIDDFINGGELSMFAAQHMGKIPDAAGLLRINGKNSELDIKYTKKAEKYNNPDELPEKFKDIIKNKLKSQGLNPNSKGLYFHSDSELSKRIAASPQILNKIVSELDDIPFFCDYENPSIEKVYHMKKHSIEYGKETGNFYYAFHFADIHNLKTDIFGNISGDLVDTTDFNPGKNEPVLIQKAGELQEEGKIEPKFIIVHFVVPKEMIYSKLIKENKHVEKNQK